MRVHFGNDVFFVTNRCEEERFFMLPRAKVNHLIGTWLAKALEKYGDGIEIFAFIFLSNHFHILLRDNKGQLAKFMWYLQLNLGKAINKLNNERIGHFFCKKYDAAFVATDEDFIDRYAYVVTNAVKAGLVSKASAAPFFSSLPSALSEKPMRFKWIDWTAFHNRTRRNQKVDIKEFERVSEIRLAAPPMWASYSKAKRGKVIAQLVKQYERRYAKERRAVGTSVLGAQKIKGQKWWMRPKNPARRPRVKVFCRIKELKEEILDAIHAMTSAYRDVYQRFYKWALSGRLKPLPWPKGAYPPSFMAPVAMAD